MSTGKDVRNLIVIRDPLIANAVTLLFAFKSFRNTNSQTSHIMTVLAGIGVLLLFASRLISHLTQAAEEREPAAPSWILDADGKPLQGSNRIGFVDRLAYVAYLASWLVVIWSTMLYLYATT
jgi:hypothetical protein